MKILIVYEVVPEETKLFVFENVNPDGQMYQNFLLANGAYGNTIVEEEIETALDQISSYLETHQELEVADLPTAGPFDAVILTGFVL